MTTVARDELDKFGAEIEECAVVYLPQVLYIDVHTTYKLLSTQSLHLMLQLGYLLAVPCTARMKEAQDFEIDGLEFVV